MGLSVWQIVLVVIVFLLLFGRGKIPALMGDLAQGIKSFKTGMRDEPEGERPAAASEAAHGDTSTKNRSSS